jgi:hypothetical protein
LPTVPLSARAISPGRKAGFRLVPLAVLAWLASGVTLVFTHPLGFDWMSTDDFMRLVEVRDFLGGQGWFDLTQYRIDPPAGVVMHWSRLADLPPAALIAVLSPLTGRDSAEAVTSMVWPILLFLPALLLAGAIARRLAGEVALVPAVLLVAACAPVLTHFRPGALDHHGIQLVLLLAIIYALTARTRIAPALGGIAAALSLAIGLEMAPALAAVLAAVGLAWIMEGGYAARTVSRFGLALAAATALLFVATVPYSQWASAACDRISPATVTAAALSGGLLSLLAALPIRSRAVRLAAGIAAGGATLALIASLFPACLRDPYAGFDPRLSAIWLSHVAEAQNIFEFTRMQPNELPVIYGAPLSALLLAAIAFFRLPKDEQTRWLPSIFALAALLAVSLWEIRGAAGANLVAMPVLAAAVTRVFRVRRFSEQPRAAILLLALSAPVLTLAGKAAAKAISLGGMPATFYTGGPLSCSGLSGIAPLKTLARGLVLSYVDLGPAILAGTKHSVLAAPSHRNGAGNRLALDILLGDDKTARRLLAERHVNYVAICPGSPERFNLRGVTPTGLSERLARGDVPAYLTRVGDSAAPLLVFRVR